MAKKIILDVDTGTDDAVAIMLAALSPGIELLACTTVWGNLPVTNTTDNTLRVLDHIGRSDVPVYRGLDAPFGTIQVLADVTIDPSEANMHPPQLDLPDAITAVQTQPAVEWLVETLRAATEPVTLVPVGPLTNIAAAITLDPAIVAKVEEIVIMGGANEFGNITASAEANIWHDPVAADVVFQAGFKRLVLVPLDATHDALITGTQARELATEATPAATAAADCITHRIQVHTETQPEKVPDSAAVHDPLCIAYLLDPEVVALHHCYLGVETRGDLTFGRTVIDIRHRDSHPPNAHVALAASSDRFFQILKTGLGRG